MKKLIIFIMVFLTQIAFMKIEANDCGNMDSHKAHSKEQKTERVLKHTEEEREMKMAEALARLKKESGDTTKFDTAVTKEEEINKDCSVMGRAVNKKINYEYNGRKYYFCCPSCIDTFKKDPEKYAEILKGKKETEKKNPNNTKT